MGDPDLYSDESIRLTAENIVVKSAPFEAILTNKRIILVDGRKKHIPQQTILLATIKSVEMTENAIRDPVISISVLTNTGATRQMLLTFSKKAGGDRHRECEDWMKILKESVTSTTQTVSYMATPSPEPEAKPEPEISTPPQIRMTSSAAVKKKIEIARPIKKIIETGPVAPAPVEAPPAPVIVPESLPVVEPAPEILLPEGSFCSRCGNRVPPESAFCNRCGTKVVVSGEPVAEPGPVVPQVQLHVPQQVPAPAEVPAAHEPAPVRPIEQIIHSIEPLIEDSVPRTEPAPLVVRDYPAPAPAVEIPVPAVESPSAETPTAAEAVPLPGEKSTPLIVPSLAWQEPGTPPAAPPVPPAAAPPVPPVPGTGPGRKKRPVMLIAAIIVIILIVATGAVVLMKPGAIPGPGATPTVTPTATIPATTRTTAVPTVTTTAPITTLPTTPASAVIPQTGVWIRITYAGTFTGTYGTPGSQAQVTDTGDRLYQIPTANGPVAASIRKQDGSADKLTVTVYKNGELIKEESTVVPRGTIEFYAILSTPTPTPVPTTISDAVTTVITTKGTPPPTVTPSAANTTASA